MPHSESDELRGTLAERVEEILPKIRERAAENEEARQLIDANFADLASVGFFRALVPKQFGGLESDVRDWLQAIRRVASADPATGWSAGIMSAHAHGLNYFPERLHEEVWGTYGPDAIVSSGTPADGTAEWVDGRAPNNRSLAVFQRCRPRCFRRVGRPHTQSSKWPDRDVFGRCSAQRFPD